MKLAGMVARWQCPQARLPDWPDVNVITCAIIYHKYTQGQSIVEVKYSQGFQLLGLSEGVPLRQGLVSSRVVKVNFYILVSFHGHVILFLNCLLYNRTNNIYKSHKQNKSLLPNQKFKFKYTMVLECSILIFEFLQNAASQHFLRIFSYSKQ